ncbi:pyocin activator PrtN family protein [Shewanella japonica]|uniref:pyocin activator PrtN family protein n=1 Tax=Shewanella japonica TaxID=93973 RepID=UPI002493E266|nr:pyocin activator PrtN family protein [Shewanella japonica]
MTLPTLPASKSKHEQQNIFALITVAQHLIEVHNSPLLPYLVVAKDYLGYKTDKTAKAKLHDGTIEKLGLVPTSPYLGRKAPVFIKAFDLANYLIQHRNVEISHY